MNFENAHAECTLRICPTPDDCYEMCKLHRKSRDVGAGWMFSCPKCLVAYHIDGPTDTCPICNWRDGNKEPPADWSNEK